MSDENDGANYQLFRECFSAALIERIAQPEGDRKATRKRRGGATERKKQQQQDNASREVSETADGDFAQADQEGLGDFIEFLASEIFPSLPPPLQTLSHRDTEETFSPYTSLTLSAIDERIVPLLPSSVPESVSTYSILPPTTSLSSLLLSTLDAYVEGALAPPPSWSTALTRRASECEICGRDWIPLTYHHLIPRSVHAKAIKRGWHEDERALNSVAWLCRACHTFVHRAESNETLAREYYTVDRLLEREDVQNWAKWVGRIRWKAR